MPDEWTGHGSARSPPTKGDTVEVIAGRKVPIGTTGVVFWLAEGQWGLRLGIRTPTGTTWWTYGKNVRIVSREVTEPLDDPATVLVVPPDGNIPPGANRFPGACVLCGGSVQRGVGKIEKTPEGKWTVKHEDGDCRSAEQAKVTVLNPEAKKMWLDPRDYVCEHAEENEWWDGEPSLMKAHLIVCRSTQAQRYRAERAKGSRVTVKWFCPSCRKEWRSERSADFLPGDDSEDCPTCSTTARSVEVS